MPFLAMSAQAQTGTAVRVSYEFIATDATVNAPVFVRVVVENGLPDELTFRFLSNPLDYGGFRGSILRPDGETRSAPREHPESLGGSSSVNYESIQPFSKFTKVLLANKWFDFDIPGRYFVELETTNILAKDRAKLLYPTRGETIVDVAPRDPTALERICADLEQRVMNAPNTLAETEPAEALAYVTDPVAVPHLARLLRAKERHLAPMLTEALGRIADLTAVDALISVRDGPAIDEDTPAMARGALNRIEMTTNDIGIKLKIQNSRH